MKEELKERLRGLPLVQFLLPCFRVCRIVVWKLGSSCRLIRLRKRTTIWLELGGRRRKGWVTLDRNGTGDVFHDLLKGIPFKDDSVERIYSSHLFEHFASPDASVLIGECMRVLKDGGEFSIAVPNARLYIDAYVREEKGFRGIDADSPIDYIRFTAYCNGAHKNMFDCRSLCVFLEKAGFADVAPREFDPEIDVASRRDETIYARGFARKATGKGSLR